MLTLDVFSAEERPDLEALYSAGQERSYGRHPGSDSAVLPGRTGADRIVLARTPDGEAHAGMRVQLRRAGELLPVEQALGDLCPVSEAVARAPGPLVELCGTWVDTAFRDTGLAGTMCASAVAAARMLEARQIVGCSHQHVLPLYEHYGAAPDPVLGFHPYPDERYVTCVVWADPYVCGAGQATVDAIAAQLASGDTLRYPPVRTPG